MHRALAISSLMFVALISAAQGSLRWLESAVDMGTIHEDGGKVSCTFHGVNDGDAPLVIVRIQSTCGCTVGEYSHDVVAPGDTAWLRLTYNPIGRPGEFKKDVFVFTNGEPQRTMVTITGQVIAAERTLEVQYPAAVGDLRLEAASVPFGEITRGKRRRAELIAYNASLDTLALAVSTDALHIGLNVVPDTIPPATVATLFVSYDSNEAPLWGLNIDSLSLSITPLHSAEPATRGTLMVMAQVTEDFSKLTDEQRRDAPSLDMRRMGAVIDCGTMTRGDVVTRTLTIANTGKNPLHVRRLWSADAAITTAAPVTEIDGGKSATIDVTIDSGKADGDIIDSQLLVMTDDPYAPRAIVRIVGRITDGTPTD